MLWYMSTNIYILLFVLYIFVGAEVGVFFAAAGGAGRVGDSVAGGWCTVLFTRRAGAGRCGARGAAGRVELFVLQIRACWL